MLFIQIASSGLWKQIEEPVVVNENNYIQYDEHKTTVAYKDRIIKQLEEQNRALYQQNMAQEVMIARLQDQLAKT